MIRTLLALALLVVAVLAGVAIGETAISPQVVLQVLANKLWAAGYVLDPIDEGVVWNYRLTRALVAHSLLASTCSTTCGEMAVSPMATPASTASNGSARASRVRVICAGRSRRWRRH